MNEAEDAMQLLGAEFAQACSGEPPEMFDRMLVHVTATVRVSPRFARMPEHEARLLLLWFQQAARKEYGRAQARSEIA